MDREVLEIRSEKVSWAGVLAGLVIFLLPVTVADQPAGVAGLVMRFVSPVVWLLCLAILVLGFARRIPRWGLPYVGLLASIISYVAVLASASMSETLSKIIGMILPKMPVGDEAARLRSSFWGSGMLWLAMVIFLALVVLLIIAIPAFRRLWLRLRADWTQVTFLLYGMIVPAMILSFDEHRYDALPVSLAMIFLAAGAVLYLRLGSPWRRWLWLFGGATMAYGAAALGKYIIVPMQDWTYWFSIHPPQTERVFEALGAGFEWFWLSLAMLAPALLSILPPRRTPEPPPPQPAAGLIP